MNIMLKSDATKRALALPHFPTRLQAVVWRNWELVPPARLAAILQATETQILDLAAEMGLPVPPEVNSLWIKRGYVTIVRANWHLLSFAQLMELLDWTEEQLLFTLKEDDSLWIKMGRVKPVTEPVFYRPLTIDEQKATAILRARIQRYFPPGAAVVETEAKKEGPFAFLESYLSPEHQPKTVSFPASEVEEQDGVTTICDGWKVIYPPGTNHTKVFVRRFCDKFKAAWGIELEMAEADSVSLMCRTIRLELRPDSELLAESHQIFVEVDCVRLTAVDEVGLLRGLLWIARNMKHAGTPQLQQGLYQCRTKIDLRFIYSYFAVYGDPLTDSEAELYPEALLEELSEAGVNGIWMQCILYKMVPWEEDLSLSCNWETRIASLNRLVAKAAEYGIGIYLYFNELRGMPLSFFETRPDWKGHSDDGVNYAMCTSVPEVKRFLEEGTCRLFREVPELAGLFSITMSENLTNCHSRAYKDSTGNSVNCPRCKDRPVMEVSNEVNRLITAGVRRASAKARVIIWTWGWVPSLGWTEDTVAEAIRTLPDDVTIMCVSEEGKSTNIAGIPGEVVDYALSIVGPSEKSARIWKLAKERGLPCAAKVQINNTWECAFVPYLPVFDLIEEHLRNLRQYGVSTLMLSWTLGGYISPSLELASRFYWEENGKEPDGIKGLLKHCMTEHSADIVLEASTMFSQAFREFPFHVGVLYTAPQNYGPSNRLYLEPTGYQATMVGIPYDDLDCWRAIYPREVFVDQLDRLSRGWKAGVERLKAGLQDAPRGDIDIIKELLTMARAAYCHFRSTCLQSAFVLHRDLRLVAQEASERVKESRIMLEIIDEEIELARQLHQIVLSDSRIGYEASCHYFYTARDLQEKVLNALEIKERLTIELQQDGRECF